MCDTYLHMCIHLYVTSRLPCICKVPFSLENCGSHDCGAKACLHFITFSDVLFVSSVLLGVLSTHDHGFHGFWGYIAYSLLRANAGCSLAVPPYGAQLK